MNRHPLYAVALAADQRYTDAIAFVSDGRRDRWTATVADELTQAVREALAAKLAADAAWLAVLREDSLQRTARKEQALREEHEAESDNLRNYE